MPGSPRAPGHTKGQVGPHGSELGRAPTYREGPAVSAPLLFTAARGLGQTCPRVTDEDTGIRTKFRGSFPFPEDVL